MLDLTSELIKQAMQRDSSHCMIAEAVKAAYPNATHVSVDLQTIRFTDKGRHRRYTYLTPRTAQLALVDFDQGVPPEPFRMTLRGGQVTFAGSRQTQRLQRAAEQNQPAPEKREASEDARAANKKNSERARLARQTLAFRHGEEDHPDQLMSGAVPDRIGGSTPPLGHVRDADGKSTPFARRRAFGLRALAR